MGQPIWSVFNLSFKIYCEFFAKPPSFLLLNNKINKNLLSNYASDGLLQEQSQVHGLFEFTLIDGRVHSESVKWYLYLFMCFVSFFAFQKGSTSKINGWAVAAVVLFSQSKVQRRRQSSAWLCRNRSRIGSFADSRPLN